jgi:4-amino-4-deoxy-L-arabinose transferase-like glycosyltransferase
MSNQEAPGPTPGDDRLRRFVAFVGLMLVLVGQFVLFALPIHENVVIPPFFWMCVAGVVLFLVSRLMRTGPAAQHTLARLPSGTWWWVVTALLLSALAALSAVLFRIYGSSNFLPVTALWIVSAMCYLAAFRTTFRPGRPLREWFVVNRNELLLLSAVVLLAFFLRFYQLGVLPRVIDGDEGRMGLAAQSTTGGRLANPFALFENFGGLYLQISNLSISLFGANAFGLRLVPAISGVLAIPATYLLARRIAGQRVAFIAAMLLATSHTHMHFSRIASVGYIHDTWLVPTELFLLISGIEKRRSWRTGLAGALLALHLSIYLTSQIVIGLVAIFLLLAFVFMRSWIKPALPQVAAFWAGFLILAIPAVVYVLRQPTEFLNRLTANGTFQTGWLASTVASTGKSAFQVLAERVVHAFMALIYYPAFDFYGSPYPMLSLVSAMLFLIGLGIALTRVASPHYLLLNGYFWGFTVAIGVFAIPPSADSYRMLMALPAALILAAIGLDQILTLFGIGWSASRTGYALSVGTVLGWLVVFNLWAYYGDFAGRCRFGNDLAGRFASYLGSYVHTISSESSVYLLSDQFLSYGTHASTDFLSHGRSITNFPGAASELDAVSGETVIAVPARIDELEAWARAHPGGNLRYQYDCRSPILLAYQVP